METKKRPPRWWSNVIRDISQIVAQGRQVFDTPGTVVEIPTDENGVKKGIVVRMVDGSFGYYPSSTSNLPSVGVQVKNKLPEPDVLVQEPEYTKFLYEMIVTRVKLIPKIWLYKVIKKMVRAEPITYREDFKPFPEWIMLPESLKKDKTLIDILYRVTRYEGIRGLERFNDKAVL